MMTLKELKAKDARTIAILHEVAFENFFLTSLGLEFLTRFYKSIIVSNDGMALGAFDEKNDLVGFAIGAKAKNEFYKTLLIKNFISLFFSAILELLKQPIKIQRLIRSLQSSESSNFEYGKYATLLSICVNPNHKGQKVGKFLLKAFESEAKKFSAGISLTTDKYRNEYVNNFYILNGYTLTYNFSQGSREMNFYIKKFE